MITCRDAENVLVGISEYHDESFDVAILFAFLFLASLRARHVRHRVWHLVLQYHWPYRWGHGADGRNIKGGAKMMAAVEAADLFIKIHQFWAEPVGEVSKSSSTARSSARRISSAIEAYVLSCAHGPTSHAPKQD